MAIRARAIPVVVLIFLALFHDPLTAAASGPFFPRAVFTYKVHPHFPLTQFARGELGILLPTYRPSYLYVAYRHLAGLGLDRDEERAVLALWKEALYVNPEPELSGTLKAWLEARSKVPGSGPPPEIDAYRRLIAASFFTYVNCWGDAFRVAARTLQERAKQFGASSPEVREWLEAQDKVFANCSGGEYIPSPAGPASPALIRADRAYQIAAAHFYAGHFDEAEKRFREIAKDRS